MRRVYLGAVVVLGAIGIGPAAALAHPVLSGAAPTPGLVSPRSPEAVVLSLSEPAVARGSSVSLVGANGERVLLGPVRVSSDGRTLSASLPHDLRPAVYAVAWKALGQDGHVVSGSWSFGVAGPGGEAPPGAGRLGGAAVDTRGSQEAGLEGPLRIGARWLGIVAGAFLLGGLALRRRATGPVAEAWLRLAPRAWAAAVAAALTDALLVAATGAGGFDAGLLTASGSGTVALARLLLLAALTPALALARRPRAREVVFGAGACGVLATYALEGHALAGGGAVVAALQVAHSLSAGVWLGGLLLLALSWRSARAEARVAARAFAPLAGSALLVSVATGVPIAVREIGHWYFLRYSDYGRVVILKAALVLVVALVGVATAWLARRGGLRGRVLRSEAVLLAAVVALAAVLGGLAQGRGHPLPAVRGTLLPGPAFAGAVLPGGPVQITLAPARAGANTVALGGEVARGLGSARVQLTCPSCAGRPSRSVALSRRAPGAPLSATVSLPSDGAWYATVDGASAVLVSTGVPRAPGAPPVTVLSVADLSGPDGERCRSYLLGVELAIGRINAAGGLAGGRKVAPLVLDDGGDPGRAATLAHDAIGRERPLAFVPCGSASAAALAAAGGAGVPSLVGDPAVQPVTAPRTFRLAADPWADGVALAQYIRRSVQPRSSAEAVRVVMGADDQGRRRLAGLR